VQPNTAYQEPWVVVKLGRLTSTIKAAPEPKLIKKNANPQFNQVLDMEFDDVQAARLEVEIRDVDEHNKEQVIGALRLRLQNLAKKIASTASYKLTVPHVTSSKAELELSLEAQDFDTSDGNYGMSGTSYVPGHGVAAGGGGGGGTSISHSGSNIPHMGASGGMPAPSAASSSSSLSSSSLMHAVLPSQSPISMPHQPPTRAAIQQYPPPVNYNPKDIKRVHPHIAKGSYGVVYKGTVPDVKEVVVIKDMDFTNQKALDDWRKEIKMMAKTSCEYVVRVLGYATAERTLTIVMEFMTKGSLYDVLHNRKETLSVITRMRMARHCALGLQHLHDLKVMHRDIKSMNILVNDGYSCKLTDFGCAKSLNDQGAILNTANSGTPLWMAPEVKLGHYDFSADIYSLGLVIYELLEKRLPQYDQIRAQVIIPRDYDSKDIVGPCLNPDPRRRPKASEIVHKLDCVIRNIITSIRKHLKEEELKELGLPTSPETDQLDSEISALYQILLKKDPKTVDTMVYQAFGSSPEKASANQPEAPMPSSSQQQPFMPGAMPVFPGGVQMAPMGYPPGFQAAPYQMQMPPSFGQPAYGTPPAFVRFCFFFLKKLHPVLSFDPFDHPIASLWLDFFLFFFF
jgi:serine/threonine protein kinase